MRTTNITVTPSTDVLITLTIGTSRRKTVAVSRGRLRCLAGAHLELEWKRVDTRVLWCCDRGQAMKRREPMHALACDPKPDGLKKEASTR